MKILQSCTIIILFLLFNVGLKAKEVGEVILDDTLNGINVERLENYLVYYTYSETGSTPTNQWGYEISVNSDNLVVEVDTKVTVYPGGYVISGHGTKVDDLMNVKVGDIVAINNDNLEITIIRDLIKSSLFLANESVINGKFYYNSALASFYEFDEVWVDNAIKELDEIKNRISELKTDNTELNNEDSKIIRKLVEDSTKLLEEIIYRTSKSNQLETRAIWHRPNATVIKEQNIVGVKKFVSKVKELGFNTIYVEAYYNGYATYRSDILETHPSVSTFYYGEEYAYDYIAALIGEANKLGIDVHAWSHTFNAGGSTYKSKKIKDEWLVEDYQGRKLHPNSYAGSYYLDPSNEEVLEFVESIFEEMVQKYNFAGIQLDYIRYYDNDYSKVQIRDSGFSLNAENDFKNKYGLTGDVRTLVKSVGNRKLWNEYRQNNITEAVRRLSTSLKEINKDIIISASVVSDIKNAKDVYMQDWEKWVKKGYIDLLVPMIYTGSIEAVRSGSISIKNILGNLSYLNSGIAPGYYGYSSLINHEQIKATNSTGGSAIFASQNVIGISEIEQLLKVGLYRETAVAPLAKAKVIVDSVLNHQHNYIEKYLKQNVNYEMFKKKIDSILKMECVNPNDYQEIIVELNDYKQLISNHAPSLIAKNVSENIDLLINTLDIKISRELINLGHYNPGDGPRPNPIDFDYESEIIEDNPKEEAPQVKTGRYLFVAGGIAISLLGSIFVVKRRLKERGI